MNYKFLSNVLIILGIMMLAVGIITYVRPLPLPFALTYSHTLDVATNLPYDSNNYFQQATDVGGKCIWSIPNVEISTSFDSVTSVNGKLAILGMKFNGDPYYLAYEINQRLIVNGYGAAQWIKVDGVIIDPNEYTSTPTPTITATTSVTTTIMTPTTSAITVTTETTDTATTTTVTSQTSVYTTTSVYTFSYVTTMTSQGTTTVSTVITAETTTITATATTTSLIIEPPRSLWDILKGDVYPFVMKNLAFIGLLIVGLGVVIRPKAGKESLE